RTLSGRSRRGWEHQWRAGTGAAAWWDGFSFPLSPPLRFGRPRQTATRPSLPESPLAFPPSGRPSDYLVYRQSLRPSRATWISPYELRTIPASVRNRLARRATKSRMLVAGFPVIASTSWVERSYRLAAWS